MNKNNIYNFPEKNDLRAREALDLDFDIDDVKDGNLYVNLDRSRINEEDIKSDYLGNIKYKLHIDLNNGNLRDTPADHVKILFSGHRGSGKTLELRRLQEELHNPKRYFSIFIEIEKEAELANFESEDYFIWMIVKLIRSIDDAQLGIQTPELDKLLEDWLSDTEINKSLKKSQSKAKVLNIGFFTDILKFFKFGLNWKEELASKSEVAQIIRQKVKKNARTLVARFNLALQEVRKALEKHKQGKDILFIMDGSEKVSKEVYEQFFIKDDYIIRTLDVNMIISVRLDTLFNLDHRNALDNFDRVLLPMVNIREETYVEDFSEVIGKRLQKELFFEEGVLEFFVQKSGGSIRQLLRIVRDAIGHTRGRKIKMKNATYTIKALKEDMIQMLTTAHRKILLEQNWGSGNIAIDSLADPDIAQLIQQLVLLKYNGHIEINPLIADEFTT